MVGKQQAEPCRTCHSPHGPATMLGSEVQGDGAILQGRNRDRGCTACSKTPTRLEQTLPDTVQGEQLRNTCDEDRS